MLILYIRKDIGRTKYFSVRMNPSMKKSNVELNRKGQIVLNRLWCDDLCFKYKHFYLNDCPQKGKCEEMNKNQKVEHILICERFKAEKNHLRSL